MVRIGIIGLGNMGRGHANNLLTGKNGKIENAVLSAVCDVEKKPLEWAQKQNPDIKVFDNHMDLIKSGEVDAIIIATPHYDHPPISMDALANGVHVLTEKPAGVYTKQVRELNEFAAKCDKVFAIMYNQRTNPMYIKMREMVQSGEVGDIKRTSWIITDWYRTQAYYDSGGWRATWKGEGGGVLLNQCPHNLDIWQWICGMPNKVHAFAHNGKWHNIEVEDDVTAYVEYENGATGVFITTTADCPGNNRFEVMGDKGKLICEHGKLIFHKLSVSEREFNKTSKQGFGSPEVERIEIECPGRESGHAGVLNAFIRKILGTGELIAYGNEGINGLTISNAMHLSSWTGKTVTLPLDEELFLSELKKRW